MIINYLHKAMSLPSIEVVSFDFFDTLVWRKFPKPIDLFLELGNRLIERNILASPRSANGFALLRKEVESHARQTQLYQRGMTEVTLEQIYEAFPDCTFSVDRNVAKEVELEVEREFLVADKNLIETLQSVAKTNKSLVICSDTYFSQEQMSSLVEHSGIPTDLFDRIYASSEYGISKSEGLISKVLSSCEVEPEQLLHIGDHPYKDGHSAKMLGSIYIRYPEVGTHGEYAQKRFQNMASVCSKTKPFLDSEGGILGVCRRFKSTVSDYPSETVEIEMVGYNYGPLFCGFAEWIETEANKFSPDIIFCPTREGRFLSVLLNKYFTLAKQDYKAQNFLTSRAALSKGNFYKADYVELEKYFLGRRLPLTVRKFISVFDLNIKCESLPFDETCLDYPIRRECEVSKKILLQLAANTSFSSALLDSSAKARERLIKYFESQLGSKIEKLHQGSLTILIADVGWSGSSQRIFEKIIKTRYPSVNIRGRYLMLSDGAYKNFIAGVDLEGWLLNLGEIADFGNTIMPVKELLEQVLMAEMPSTVNYTEDGKPIFFDGENKTPILQKIQIQRIQKLVLSFLDSYWQLCKSYEENEVFNRVSFLGQEEFFRTTLAAQAYSPEERELELFGRWEHEDNDVAFVQEKIINNMQQHLFQHATLREIFRTPSYWHLGNLQLCKSQLKEKFFVQQLTGEYGLQDVYRDTSISYQIVNQDNEILSEADARIELTDDNTGIIVCHLYTQDPVRIVYTNTSGMNLSLDRVLLESYDTNNYIVNLAIQEPGHESIKVTAPDRSQEEHSSWFTNWNIDLNLTDCLSNATYDATVILCVKIL